MVAQSIRKDVLQNPMGLTRKRTLLPLWQGASAYRERLWGSWQPRSLRPFPKRQDASDGRFDVCFSLNSTL